MKNRLLYSVLIASSVATLSSCDPDDWNNKLNGFDSNKKITDIQFVDYTFTADDYANLASNSKNIERAASLDLSNELKAVGTQHYFTDKITAREFVPNFLNDPDFAYFSLSDGSTVTLTYNTVSNVPEEVVNFGAASEYTVTEADYQDAWGSETDFIEGFTPNVSAQKNILTILSIEYGDAEKGDMVVVNYKEAQTEPNFDGGDDPEPGFVMTSVLGSATVGSNVEVKGLVTAICGRGFILTDNSGSILVYYSSGFDATTYSVGDQVEVAGEVSSYNKGMQITGTSATVNKIGNQAYSYPAATKLDGAAFDNLLTITDDQLATYAQFVGTASISGNYYNFTVAGAETAKGSLYQATDAQKALFEDGKTYTVSGYFVSISGGKYVNFVPTTAVETASLASMRHTRAATSVTTESVSAVYSYDGSTWKASTSVTLLQASDYTAMGQTHANLTAPDEYLPTYLKNKFPYAKSGDTKLVAYKYYASSKTSLVCDEYTFNGTAWTKTNGMVTETAQFVRSGGNWMYDPNVTIDLPSGKGVEISTKYYQACVDWVYENIDKPLGSTGIKDGNYYVSSYGNNEYYSGTSAYQGNVDLRPAKARDQYPAGYEGKSDDEIQKLMMDRFTQEVLPGALSALHPDAEPVEGIDVIYTVNFAVYTGSTATYTVNYKVIGKGKFEFIECNWYVE